MKLKSEFFVDPIPDASTEYIVIRTAKFDHICTAYLVASSIDLLQIPANGFCHDSRKTLDGDRLLIRAIQLSNINLGATIREGNGCEITFTTYMLVILEKIIAVMLVERVTLKHIIQYRFLFSGC
jgi:hypothetical protein